MFITKKAYDNAMREAVEKALREHDEHRWQQERMNDLQDRLERLSREVWELQEKLRVAHEPSNLQSVPVEVTACADRDH